MSGNGTGRRQPDTDLTLQDRARGCAVGAAVGDALGMPLEFKPPRPSDDLVREMIAGRIPAGTFTDDTEMALALADSLLEQTPLDASDLAYRFVEWFRSSPSDIGLHTRSVLARMAQGEFWDEAVDAAQQERPDSAGNGSLMRTWPVALAEWNRLDELLVDSWKQSRVTHPHPDCLTACAFVNAVIYHLLHGHSPEHAVLNAAALVKMPETFWEMIRGSIDRGRDELANTGWVRHTLESAVWALLSTHSFEEALVQVVNLGNDADTAGAVVGALAGAAYGIDAIPPRWTAALRGEWPLMSRKIWQVDDFIALADRLVALDAASRDA